MNVEIGAEAALFPEKEHIKGIFVAVYMLLGTIFKQLNLTSISIFFESLNAGITCGPS
jgi:hypothetical protein